MKMTEYMALCLRLRAAYYVTKQGQSMTALTHQRDDTVPDNPIYPVLLLETATVGFLEL